MIAVDASALLEVLLRTPNAPLIERRLFRAGETLHAPHLIDVEVAHVVRGYAAAGDIDDARGREVLTDLADFPLHRYPHTFLLPRVWKLRRHFTAYDAVYLSLAEALDTVLITRDRRFATAAYRSRRIELV